MAIMIDLEKPPAELLRHIEEHVAKYGYGACGYQRAERIGTAKVVGAMAAHNGGRSTREISRPLLTEGGPAKMSRYQVDKLRRDQELAYLPGSKK
jgi:hypothetical protein